MAAGVKSAWCLNLDADRELASAGPYMPKASVLAKLRHFAARLAETLVGPDDIVVDESSLVGSARGFVGRAFSPTPRALAILAQVAAEPAPHPPLDVLRRVTSRAFSAGLGTTLPDACFVTEEAVAIAKLAQAPKIGHGWRVKRAFGMAGREHRIVDPGRASVADLGFVRGSLEEGGVMIEPNVVLEEELAIHGFLDASGLRVGELVVQRTDTHGAWQETRCVPRDEKAKIRSALQTEAKRVAEALRAAGYVGPFGIDAFTWRGPEGVVVLNPRSEVNARYTMGFGVGFGRIAT